MKFEEIMPQLRAGKKVRVAALDEGIYFYYVEGVKPSDLHEFGSDEPYTGFIGVKNGEGYFFDMPGSFIFREDWELYHEPIITA